MVKTWCEESGVEVGFVEGRGRGRRHEVGSGVGEGGLVHQREEAPGRGRWEKVGGRRGPGTPPVDFGRGDPGTPPPPYGMKEVPYTFGVGIHCGFRGAGLGQGSLVRWWAGVGAIRLPTDGGGYYYLLGGGGGGMSVQNHESRTTT